MSEYIPFEIQVEVIKRLPVKSLVQFRSVSKSWRCLIDSSEFIAGYRVSQAHPQRLLVWYNDSVDTKQKYVSFVDDETLVQQELVPTVPMLSNLLYGLELVGSSKGLLCFYGYFRDPGRPCSNDATEMVALWNPSIRKSVGIVVPRELSRGLEVVFGFWVCPITSDPMIVKITNHCWYRESEVSSYIFEVFTLSRGSWRIACSNQLKKSIQVYQSQVIIDSFIYWYAFDMDDMDDMEYEIPMHKSLIISFDITTEEFRVIDLPKNLAYHSPRVSLSISKVQDCIAVLEYTHTHFQAQRAFQVCAVWIMDPTVPNSFTKLYNFSTPYGFVKILGFTKNGRPILETNDGNYLEKSTLAVYEPSSEHVNDIGINAKYGSYVVSPYMETLLLLDQSDCKMWD